MHGSAVMARNVRRTGKRGPIIAVQFSNPTAERMRHAGADVEEGGDIRSHLHLQTMRDSPLERALFRRVITNRQYEAGAKFRKHWHFSGMQQLRAINYGGVFGVDDAFGMGAKTVKQAFHRQQYRAAVEHLGAIATALVEAVVCQDRTLQSVAPDYGWSSKGHGIEAVTGRLIDALERLCKLWGM